MKTSLIIENKKKYGKYENLVGLILTNVALSNNYIKGSSYKAVCDSIKIAVENHKHGSQVNASQISKGIDVTCVQDEDPVFKLTISK